MKITKSRRLFGTLEMLLAAVIIVLAVMFAPAKKEITPPPTTAPETTAPAVETTTEAVTQPTETQEATTDFAQVGDYTVTNYIVVTADSAMEMYSIASEKLTNYANVINTFAAKVPDKQIYCMLAPTSIAFYGPEEYRTGSHSQPDGINIAYSALSGANIKSIDAYGEIIKHTNDYIYFRTDHHWTARGAYYAYTALCNQTGQEAVPLENHQSGRLDDFVGTMYRYTQSESLLGHPDYVEYFYPVNEYEGYWFTTPALSDPHNLRVISTGITERSSKYMCFIQGDKPLERITTSNQNGKKILVIKESYGNAIVPFLLDNYQEVYVLDPRQDGVTDMNLPQFVTDNGINEILFINYVLVPSNSKYMNALTNIVNKDVAVPEAAETPAEAPQG